MDKFYQIRQSRTGHTRQFKTNNGYVIAEHMSRGYWVFTEVPDIAIYLTDTSRPNVWIEPDEHDTPQGLEHWRMCNPAVEGRHAETVARREAYLAEGEESNWRNYIPGGCKS